MSRDRTDWMRRLFAPSAEAGRWRPFADVYRSFFESSGDDTVTGLRPQGDLVVYDAEGNAHGTVDLRLPLSPSYYFALLKPGHGIWVGGGRSAIPLTEATASVRP